MSSLKFPGSDFKLNRRYRIGEKIGEGGMGQVYAAKDEQFGLRDVAIKFLHPSENRLDDADAKFWQEALTTGKLNHPCIVKVYNVHRVEPDPQLPSSLIGAYFMVMEYVPGETLFQQLRDGLTRRATEEWFQLFLELTRTVKFAHQNDVIHRDLKPGNIIVTEHGTAAKHGIKVLDFGIAQAGVRIQDDLCFRKVSAFCSPCGTPCYMPPDAVAALEQNRPIVPEKRHDVYALGVILYQMLTQSLDSPLLSPGVYRAICQSNDPPDRRFVAKLYDRLIINALGIEPAVQFSDAAALEEACLKLLAEKQAWEREQSAERAKREAEERARQERQQLEARHKNKRMAWTAASLVASAVMFWGGIYVARAWSDRQELEELDLDCQQRLRSAESLLSDPSVLLDRLRRRAGKSADLPRTCLRLAARQRLARVGLIHVDSQDRLAKEQLNGDLTRDNRQALDLLPNDSFAMVVAPDSGRLLFGGRNGKLLIAESSAGQLVAPTIRTKVLSNDHRGFPIIPLALSPHGGHAMAAFDGGRAARLFVPSAQKPNGEQLDEVTLIKPSQSVEISGVSVSDGGTDGLLATRDNKIFHWKISSGVASVDPIHWVQDTRAPVKHLSMIASVAGQPPLLFAATDKQIYLWRQHEAVPLGEVQVAVERLVLRSDGTIAVVTKTAKPGGAALVFQIDPARLPKPTQLRGTDCRPETLLRMLADSEPEVGTESISGRWQTALRWAQSLRRWSFRTPDHAPNSAGSIETLDVAADALVCLGPF